MPEWINSREVLSPLFRDVLEGDVTESLLLHETIPGKSSDYEISEMIGEDNLHLLDPILGVRKNLYLEALTVSVTAGSSGRTVRAVDGGTRVSSS